MHPSIFGFSGTRLTADEKSFFGDIEPFGFILFARNIEDPSQVRDLVASLKDCVTHDPYITLDQEGGRVARLKPPHWPFMSSIGALLADVPEDEARRRVALHSRLIAAEVKALGLNSSCFPVLDIPQPDADAIIGDRAFPGDAALVASLGRVACETLLQAGVLPVIKHIPGHGRATADSHLDLPIVTADKALLDTDFAPFKALCDMPLAMTAHIAYTAFDADAAATLSACVVQQVIRDSIGFTGLLMTDDLSMKALGGSFFDRAKQSLAAGVDILLHCNGDRAEMADVAAAATPVSKDQRARFDAVLALTKKGKPIDLPAIRADYAALLASEYGPIDERR